MIDRYRVVRDATELLAAPLSAEDQTVQSMPDVSPTKWHRAHVTWFFETFILAEFAPDYQVFDPSFAYLFNSYYEAAGPRYPRPQRGLVTRPGIARVGEYRAHVDEAMVALLERELPAEALALIELGLHHEEQHQELLLMDIKHVLSCNPTGPAYARSSGGDPVASRPMGWIEHPGGLVAVGHEDSGFAFDNEGPRHEVHLEPFAVADRLVTVGEWKAFVDDGGYERPELWLSDGWATVQREAWCAPLYWWDRDGVSGLFSLYGFGPHDDASPVCHVSHYEADAFARWASKRLPTEFEWEAIAATQVIGHASTILHPAPSGPTSHQFGTDVWEWTASAYLPYPRFAPAAGAVGEYNGKFMSSQMVLRGGACITPAGHTRKTYRNFFPPAARWMMSGLRLAAYQ